MNNIKRRVHFFSWKTRVWQTKLLERHSFRQFVFHVATPTLFGRVLAIVIGLALSCAFYIIVNFVLLLWAHYDFVPVEQDSPRTYTILGSKDLSIVSTVASNSEFKDADFVSNRMSEARAEIQERGNAKSNYIRLYRIKKGLSDCMKIEFRREGSFFGRRIVVDIGLPVNVSGTPVDQRTEWWTDNNLASSNSIAQYDIVPWPVPSYPTNTNAMVTWLKAHWVTTVEKIYKDRDSNNSSAPNSLTKKDLRDSICPELQRILENDFGHLSSSQPLVWMRILNGKVQFLIFTCFFAALLVCYTRYLLFVFQEDRYISAIKKSTIGTEDDLKAASEREWNDNVKPKFVNPHGQRFGDKAESPSLQIWSGCLHALRREGNYGDVPPFLDSFKTIAEERLISSGFFLRFLIGAMPGLGFVGTVIGIPGALMETGGVLSDELAKQQSGVTSVSLALAFAFDTTLIGLVFALIGQYIMFLLNAAEESVIQNASKACLSSFIGEAQAPDTEAPRYREATVSIEVDPFVEIMAKELAALHAGNAAKPPNLSSRPLCTLSAASTPASYDEKFAKENRGPFRILTIVCLLVLMGMSLAFAIRHVVHWLLTLNW